MKKGFSFVELIVIISIISIMTVVAMVSMTKNKTERELEAEAIKIVSILREAQNNALTGKKIQNDQYPCYFRCQSNAVTNSISLGASSHESANETCGALQVVYTKTLEKEVIFSNNISIDFQVPHGDTGGNKKILIRKSVLFHTICVSKTGKIVDGKGDVNCSSPPPAWPFE